MCSQQQLVVAALVVASLVGGCRKRGGTTTTSSEEPSKASAAAVGKSPEASAAAPSPSEQANPAATGKSEFERRLYGGNPQETLRALNQLVEGWQMSNPTPLTSLEQLVSAGAIAKIPTGPAGQRYAIDPKTRAVVLTR